MVTVEEKVVKTGLGVTVRRMEELMVLTAVAGTVVHVLV